MLRLLTRAPGDCVARRSNRNTSMLWRNITSSSKCGPSTRPRRLRDRAALVAAEIARIEGRVLDAQELYEKAIRSAHVHGFVHNEAFANELAGVFYAARGYEKIATTYLREARYCYLRWGADAKVRQLDQLYPQIRPERVIPDATATIQTPVEQLDLATVIKVSEAVSGEICAGS